MPFRLKGGNMARFDSTYSGGGGLAMGIHDYRLAIAAWNDQPAKDIRFKATDAHEALVIAHMEANERLAELWRDDRLLCRIAEASDCVWLVMPATPA